MHAANLSSSQVIFCIILNIDPYLISKEHSVLFVTLGWVDPRIADKVNPSMTRNVFECDGLEVEFIVVRILYDERPRNPYLLFPLKRYIECHRSSC